MVQMSCLQGLEEMLGFEHHPRPCHAALTTLKHLQILQPQSLCLAHTTCPLRNGGLSAHHHCLGLQVERTAAILNDAD